MKIAPANGTRRSETSSVTAPRRSRRRAARIVVQVPGISRLAERELLSAPESELGKVQLAEQDSAGRAQARDRRRVLGRNVALENSRSGRRAHTRGVELILHRVGNAV